MFKYMTVKTFVFGLLALVLTACATVSAPQSSYSNEPFQIAQVALPPLPPLPLPIPVEIEPVVLEAPVLVVEERKIPAPAWTLSDRAVVSLKDSQIQCMAQAIYFEARGEQTLGMTAVGYVILNRMGHHQFPKTTCGVVYDKNRRGCQFSWVCDGKVDRIRSHATYDLARQIAVSVLTRSVENPVGDSIYFRHRSVSSRYASSQRHRVSIGNHGFFAAR